MLKQIISVVNRADTQIRKLFAPAPRAAAGLMALRGCGRGAIAIWIAAAMLNLCTMVAFAYPKLDSSLPTGMTIVRGVVKIDGLPALSGQTLFSGSSIVTAQQSDSRLDLCNRAQLKLNAESTLSLEFSRSSLSGSLQKGSLRGFVPASVRADIITADASISTDAGQPAAFSIHADSSITTISVETGRVEVRTGNTLRSITAGESFSTGHSASLLPGPQQSSNNRKWLWVLLGIGGAATVLAIAITGRDDEPPCEGGAVILSPITGGPGVCQ